MLLSHLYNYAFVLCADKSWMIDQLYPIIAWSFENGCYIVSAIDGQWAMCFYVFCNMDDIKNIDDYYDYLKVVNRKQLKGEVCIPYLVCGKIIPEYLSLFKTIMKKKGVKKIFYYKTKTAKFYVTEVI